MAGTFGSFYASSKQRRLWECGCSWSRRFIFFLGWFFCFLFTLLQLGVAPERVEPSGWQGSEQKVTSVGLVLQPLLPLPSSHHSEVPFVLWNQLWFYRSTGLVPIVLLGGVCPPLAYYCVSFLGPLKENPANCVSLHSRGEVWSPEVWRAVLPW